MLKRNVDCVLSEIEDDEIVLDIGGWAQPFNRANYVIDIMPYESRGIFGNVGGDKVHYTKDRWIVHDLSSSAPLPFRDKEIDYLICSHTLEDIRDPIHLCAEINRIAKRGYIEVPSRVVESTLGVESKHFVGYYHHRWLVEIQGNELTFRFKTHMMYASWRYRFPKSYLNRISEDQKVSYLFWESAFRYREVLDIAGTRVAKELEDFVKGKEAYPALRYVFSRWRPARVIGKFLGSTESKKRKSTFWESLPTIESR